MGRSHAKNNTTQANLTYYERSLLRKEGAARRIGNDSMKPLDHCNLCLTQIASNSAVACPSAHVFCRECALADLLEQRAAIDAQKAELARWEAEDARKRADAREAARARVVEDFEKGMGLAAARSRAAARGSGDKEREKEGSASTSTTPAPAPASGSKLANDIERITREAEDAAAALIEAEAGESRKAKIAAFWLPANAPEAPLGPLANVKLQTLCHVGEHPHPTSRKGILPVIFTYADAKRGKPNCPSCTKELNNATGAVLLTARKEVAAETGETNGERAAKKSKKSKKSEGERVCGHVVCKTCADTIVKPSNRCCVCEETVDDMLPLGKDGTGFAAAGGAHVKKQTIAFRV